VPCGQLGGIRLDLTTAPLTPNDQPGLPRSRAAQRQRRRLVVLSLRGHILSMPTIDFTEDERVAVAAFLRDSIAADPYPLAPRWRPIRSALEKIDPSPARQPLPPLKAAGEPSLVLQKMRSKRRR
jgi:hypothetical protein